MTEQGKRKVHLLLDNETADLLIELAGGARKQGEYVGRLIREQAQQSRKERLARLREEIEQLQAEGE